jgi:CspA family cold shock protein
VSDLQQGTVKWFDNAKGYGFIISAQGDDVFVHYRVIQGEGYRSLSEGQQVEFVASQSDKGWQASEVAPLALSGG